MLQDSVDGKLCPELRQWLERQHATMPSFSEYAAQSSVSLDRYMRSQKADFGRWVNQRLRIYLDMRFWIDCERGRFEPEKYPQQARLYRILCSLVRSQKAICPLCDTVFTEAMRGSPVSREKLAAVADELSLGVTLEPFEQLSRLELIHWLRSTTGFGGELHPRQDMAWIRAGHIMGIMLPYNTPFDPKTELAIQKSMLDLITDMPFSLVVKQLNHAGNWKSRDYTDYAARATEEQERHKKDFKSFQDVFAIEVTGSMEAYIQELGDLILYLYKEEHPNDGLPTAAEVTESGRVLENILRFGIREGKLGKEFPFIHIGAGLHALVRYRNEPVRKGDIYDFMHARTALPYCNYFLTEKRLGNLLTDKQLRYVAYDCKVLWKVDEIIEEMERLDGEAAEVQK